jgi:hypothetical protein
MWEACGICPSVRAGGDGSRLAQTVVEVASRKSQVQVVALSASLQRSRTCSRGRRGSDATERALDPRPPAMSSRRMRREQDMDVCGRGVDIDAVPETKVRAFSWEPADPVLSIKTRRASRLYTIQLHETPIPASRDLTPSPAAATPFTFTIRRSLNYEMNPFLFPHSPFLPALALYNSRRAPARSVAARRAPLGSPPHPT